jgi:hypothetical protein
MELFLFIVVTCYRFESLLNLIHNTKWISNMPISNMPTARSVIVSMIKPGRSPERRRNVMVA